MSRNKDRMDMLGDMFPEDAEVPTPAISPPQTQPSMDVSWATPTELVDLPSRGIFYAANHPLHNTETVEIRHMTAKDEDILTNRSLLRKGLALDRLIEGVLMNKSIKSTSLLLGDKNAILIAARVSAYGADYMASVTCPACTTQQDFEFDLDALAVKDEPADGLDDGVTKTESGTFMVTLPVSNVDIEVKFLTGADERKVTREAERKRKRNIDSSLFTDQLKSFIVSVDGDEEHLALQQFIAKMTARDARHLRRIYSELMPDINLNQEFVCENCGHEADMEVPLGSNFFWPDW
jgi:hypothetical protein